MKDLKQLNSNKKRGKRKKRATKPKTNPPMITSTKNYTKKENKNMDRQNPRTNGKSKAIQTKSHTETDAYTLTKEKKEKYIYIVAPKSTTSVWDESLSIQVLHRFRVHQVDCGDLICCS